MLLFLLAFFAFFAFLDFLALFGFALFFLLALANYFRLGWHLALYWRNGYTQLVGRKAGQYDKHKDQRMNDSEGIYDVVDGSVIHDTPVTDVIPYTKRTKLRMSRMNTPSFLYVTEDHKKLMWLGADDKEAEVQTDEPFYHYDYASLVSERFQMVR